MLLRVLSFGYPLDEFHTRRHIYRDLEEEKFRFLIYRNFKLIAYRDDGDDK
jgi:hypothetical protein